MSTRDAAADVLAELRSSGERVPHPSAALDAALATMKPVRTRSPAKALLAVGLVSAGYASIAFALFPCRVDLGYLPIHWLIGMGLFWLMATLVPLGIALVPRRGQVAPDPARAWRVAIWTGIIAIAVGFTLNVTVPGKTIIVTEPRLFLHYVVHCLTFGLVITVVPIALCSIALRRVVHVGSWRVGAAMGAAGGALSGLALHLLCPFGPNAHVALSHGGGVILCALVGALVAPVLLRNR